jgi:lipid-A-disaccharide synthase-like uncharacterized protein
LGWYCRFDGRALAVETAQAHSCRNGDRAMIYSLSQSIGDYLYDVFVTRFDLWLVFGILAQLVFTARFLVQWLASERAGRSVVPMAFWILSITGGTMTLIYGIQRREPVIIMGQALSIFIYVRNVMLIFKNRANQSESV